MRNQLIMTIKLIAVRYRRLLLVLASAICCSTGVAAPRSPVVVNGSADFIQNGNHLEIQNSDGTIINWQDFSIGSRESVNFLQSHAASSVLNRVISTIPSDILGDLTSNGRVFVINPNGLVIGQDATIDTAGFVASTLDIGNREFINGELTFSGDSGRIENYGYIAAGPGGEVVLIAPDIENHGVIEANDGAILLAAGREVVLHSLHGDGLSYRISAPGDTALNIGQLLADNGSVKVFADQLFQQGTVSASRARRDADGSIVLEADHSLNVSGNLDSSGKLVQGGSIHLLGEQVSLVDAVINASGEGGGEVLIGGDYQGDGTVKNALNTDTDADTVISADGGLKGDGGRVIVWSDNTTRSYAAITARGGSLAGDGGFVETSGKIQLDFGQAADVSASNGTAGTWLLDPQDIVIDEQKADSIASSLNGGSNVEVRTSDEGDGEGNITVEAPITKTEGDSAVTLTLDAHNRVDVNAPISTEAGPLNLTIKTGRQVVAVDPAESEDNSGEEQDSSEEAESGVSDQTGPTESEQVTSGADQETSGPEDEPAGDDNSEQVAESADNEQSDTADADQLADQDDQENDAAQGEQTATMQDNEELADETADASDTPEAETDAEEVAEPASDQSDSTTVDPSADELTESGGDDPKVDTEAEAQSGLVSDDNTDQTTELSSSESDTQENDTADVTVASERQADANDSSDGSEIQPAEADSQATQFIDQSAQQIVIADEINTGGGTVIVDAGISGDTIVSADITSSASDGQSAGDITIEGEQIAIVDQASIDASANQAGEIKIGGGQQGQDDEIDNAEAVYVAAGVEIKADGNESGDGGTVIVFAEQSAVIAGDISARGGSEQGDGGFVETSGLVGLRVDNAPDVGADNGSGGTWLIDPYDITIDDFSGTNTGVIGDVNPWNVTTTAANAMIDVNLLANALNTDANIIISTTSSGSGMQQDGNIFFDGNLLNNNLNSTLTLNADNTIYVAGEINNAGGINLNANNDIAISGVVRSNNGDINLNADFDASGEGILDLHDGATISVFNGDINVTGAGILIASSGCSQRFCSATVDLRADNINFGTAASALTGDIEILANADVEDTSLYSGGRVQIFAQDQLSMLTSGDILMTTSDTVYYDPTANAGMGAIVGHVFEEDGVSEPVPFFANVINLQSGGGQTLSANDISLASGAGQNAPITIRLADDPFDGIDPSSQSIEANNLNIDATEIVAGDPANTDLGARILVTTDGDQSIDVLQDMTVSGRYTGSGDEFDPWHSFNASIVANRNTDISVGGTLGLHSGEILLNTGFIFGDSEEIMMAEPVNGTSHITTNGLLASNGLIALQRDPSLDSSELIFTTTGSDGLIDGADPGIAAADFALRLESVNWQQEGTVEWRNGPVKIVAAEFGVNDIVGRDPQISNSGTLIINSEMGGFVFSNGDESVGSLLNTGTIIKDSADGVTTFIVEVDNQGLFVAEAGEIALQSGGLRQSAGETSLRGGNISHDGSGAGFVFTGGLITGGVSELSGVTSGGSLIGDISITDTIISPGFSPGILTIDGDLDASGGGNIFEIDLVAAAGDSAPGLGWDQVVVLGNSNIPGTNSLEVYADFEFSAPVDGSNQLQRYPIIVIAGGTLEQLPANYNVLPSDAMASEFLDNGNTELGVELMRADPPVDPPAPPPVDPPAPPPVDPPAPPPDDPPVEPPMVPAPPPVEPTPPDEVDTIVIIIDDQPVVVPVDIVDVLVSLSEEERRAYLESEKVQRRLNAVNMCIAAT